MQRRRRVHGTHRVLFGTLEQVNAVLAACGGQINTAFVERLNLPIRQHVADVGRRVSPLCQGEDGGRHPLVVSHVSYHGCVPHAA